MARDVAERIVELAQVAHQAGVDSLKTKRWRNLEQSRMQLEVTLSSSTTDYKSRLVFAGDRCGNIHTEQLGRGQLVLPTNCIPLLASGLVDGATHFNFLRAQEVCESSNVTLWTARWSKRRKLLMMRTVAPLSSKAFDFDQLKALCAEMLEFAMDCKQQD